LDWDGDDNALLRRHRERFRSCPEFRQRLGVAARAKGHEQKLNLSRPYSHVVRLAIDHYGSPSRKTCEVSAINPKPNLIFSAFGFFGLVLLKDTYFRALSNRQVHKKYRLMKYFSYAGDSYASITDFTRSIFDLFCSVGISC
jgi:hypothetical protein